ESHEAVVQGLPSSQVISTCLQTAFPPTTVQSRVHWFPPSGHWARIQGLILTAYVGFGGSVTVGLRGAACPFEPAGSSAIDAHATAINAASVPTPRVPIPRTTSRLRLVAIQSSLPPNLDLERTHQACVAEADVRANLRHRDVPLAAR